MILYAGGCSLTYGQSLEDIHPANNYPSKLAWPQLLGDMLGATQVKNLSVIGASNKEIWKTMIETSYSDNALVVVCWSHYDRWCVFKDKYDIEQVGIWKNNNQSTQFFKHLHTDYDLNVDLNMRMSHLKLHLDKLGILSYHTIAGMHELYTKENWNSADLLQGPDLYQLRKENSTALDNHHPGKECHSKFAQQLRKAIENERAI